MPASAKEEKEMFSDRPAFQPPQDWKIETDMAEPYSLWKERPGPDTAAGLLKAIDPILTKTTSIYGGAAAGPLLHSRARRMALEALPRYDPKQAKLSTFLGSQLQGLRRHADKQSNPIAVPEQLRIDRHHLFEAEGKLRDELGRPPSVAELADVSGLSFKRIAAIRSAPMPVAEGSLQSAGESGEMEQFSPAVKSPGREAAFTPWTEMVYYSVDPTDQLILEHSLGLFGKPILQNQVIARKLRVTPAAVSIRKAKLQERINEGQTFGMS